MPVTSSDPSPCLDLARRLAAERSSRAEDACEREARFTRSRALLAELQEQLPEELVASIRLDGVVLLHSRRDLIGPAHLGNAADPELLLRTLQVPGFAGIVLDLAAEAAEAEAADTWRQRCNLGEHVEVLRLREADWRRAARVAGIGGRVFALAAVLACLVLVGIGADAGAIAVSVGCALLGAGACAALQQHGRSRAEEARAEVARRERTLASLT
jgi:hypothetical protein